MKRCLTICSVLLMLACGAPAEKKEDVSAIPQSAPTTGPAADIAREVSAGLGRVGSAATGAAALVIVFDELHTSRQGQLEIAQMLVRLHDRYGLRKVSLEGAVFDSGVLTAKWFQPANDTQAVRTAREETAVRLLKEGEISAAEFIALVLPDVEVRGNEDAAEYAVELSEAGKVASGRYLFAIAQRSLTQGQIGDANDLIRSGKEKEAFELIMNSDPWVKERYEKLSDEKKIVTAEAMTSRLRELRARAEELSAPIPLEASSGLDNAIHFFEIASARSVTMVTKTLEIAQDTAPVALIVGAAHTARIVDLLKEKQVSYVVISPNALTAGDGTGDLDMPQYQQKLALRSVDQAGMLGAYLDSRRKPPPVIHKRWLQSKSEIYFATLLLARAAAGGEPPPFQSVGGELKALESIHVDPTSYEVDDRRGVLFKVTARVDDDDPARTVDIWIGGRYEPPGPPGGGTVAAPAPGPERHRRSLEELLIEARNEMKKQQTTVQPEVLLEISKGTTAVFSTDQAAVRRTFQSG